MSDTEALVPGIVGDGRQRGIPDAPVMLGARPTYRPAWWLDPARAVLLLIVPIFCLASYSNHSNYWTFKQTEDFVTPETFGLGLYSAGLMVLGIVIAKLGKRHEEVVTIIRYDRVIRILTMLSWVTIAAYVVLFGTLVVNYNLIIAFVRGSPEASNALKDSLGRVRGLTSLVQFGIVDIALASAVTALGSITLPKRVRVLVWTVVGLTVVRSVVNSERLALLEALAAIGIVRVAFRWKPSAWKNLAPYLGISFVFLIFSAGEYFRSWQFYKVYYSSYLEFALTRFGGYFSTSINNGAGQYLLSAKLSPTPEVTVGWVTKFPGLGDYFASNTLSVHDNFLMMYANPEFNSPGGLYGAFLDWHFPIASLFMVGLGLATGLIYRSFQNKALVGLLLYPITFLGLTDLIRVVYLLDTRTFPMFIATGIAWFALQPIVVPADGQDVARSGRVRDVGPAGSDLVTGARA